MKMFYWRDVAWPLEQHTGGQVTVLAPDKETAIKL